MYEKSLELAKWWLSHLTFMMMGNLMIFGGYSIYQLYREAAPVELNLEQLDDKTLSDLSKGVFLEQDSRRKG